MRALCLAMVLATTTAFAAPSITYVDEGTPTLKNDTPAAMKVDSGKISSDGYDYNVGAGVFLNEPAAVEVAKGIKDLTAQNTVLKEELLKKPSGVPVWTAVAIGLVAGLVGVGIGIKVVTK